MILNEKAQAFSTFKLLIAAIVAIAILTILFQVIGLVKPPGIDDPAAAAKDKLIAAYNSPATLQTSDSVNLEKGTIITARGLTKAASSLGMLPSQICFGADSKMEGVMDLDSGKAEYTGGATRKIKISIICDSTSAELITGTDSDWDTFFGNDAGSTAKCADLADDEIACVVVIRSGSN